MASSVRFMVVSSCWLSERPHGDVQGGGERSLRGGDAPQLREKNLPLVVDNPRFLILGARTA